MCAVLWLALSAVVLNEICYDPPGADGGAEFVELWNAGPDTASLAGLRLEFANGAVDPPVWVVRWTADPEARLAPGAVYLIVDRNWTGPPAHSEVSLGLQNGPDALRLVGTDGVWDLVGWGDLSQPELSEGDPALDVAGQVLARRPDGHDTQHNDLDFRGAEPTPGQPNWRDLAPELGAVQWSPPSLSAPGEQTVARLEVLNAGLQPLVSLRLDLLREDEWWSVPVPSVPADGRVTVVLAMRPWREGLAPVTARLVIGTTDTVSLPAGWFQVGLPDLRLAEVMAAPDQGGEWCEIMNTGLLPRSLAGLQLRDEDGSWRELPTAEVAPGECRIVAQDAPALEEWLAELAAAGAAGNCVIQPVVTCSWPSLNNTPPPSRNFADRLLLGDDQGRVLDHVTVGDAGGEAPAGRSLERRDLVRWRPATAVAGATPGCPPFMPPTADDALFLVSPNPFHPGVDPGAASLCFSVPADGEGWELRIYDLWGQLVRDLGGDDLGPGAREVVWDGHDDEGVAVTEGGYVALLVWRGGGRMPRPAHRRLVVVREVSP